MKKKIAAAVLLLLAGAGVAFYEFEWRLPPADSAAKNAPGDPAPAFALPATTDAKLALADLTKQRSAVLVFYRGDW